MSDLQSLNTLSVGMVKDASPLAQKEGSYTFALNATLESLKGDLPFISNIQGNESAGQLPSGSKIIGSVLTDSNTFVLFIVTDTTSIIGEYNTVTKSFTEIINSPSLNFSTKYPIKSLYRIRKGCERTVYFTDNNNPYRIIDLDNISKYGTPFDASKLNLYRNINIPNINISSVQDFGGDLKVGMYQFSIQYLDEDLNESSFIEHTNVVPIVDESLSGPYYSIDGGIPIIDFVDQEGSVPNTTKSIELTISNLDLTFKYYRIAVIVSAATTGAVSNVYLSQPQPITSSNTTYILRNVSPILFSETSVDYVQNNVYKIDRVGSHAEINGRLILGDLSYTQLDWAEAQRNTYKISVTWGQQAINKRDINAGSAKSPKYYLSYKSFLKDEVYALGIYGVKKDGQNTPVFHIPGRLAEAFDLDDITIVPNSNLTITSNEVRLDDVKHLGMTLADVGNTTLKRWEVYNTASNDKLAYWESEVSYPETTDCNGERIFPEGKIRHHKMPDTRLLPIEDSANIYSLGLVIDITDFLSSLSQQTLDSIQEWRICRADRTESDKTILDKGYIVTSTIWKQDLVDNGVTILSEGDRLTDYIYIPQSGDNEWDPKVQFYFSPKQMLNKPSYVGDYLSVERQMSLPYNALQLCYRWFIDWSAGGNTPTLNRVYSNYTHIDRYREIDGIELSDQNIIPTVPTYPPVKQAIDSINIVNISYSTPILAFKLQEDYAWNYTGQGSPALYLSYVSVKSNKRNIYSSLQNLQYVDLYKTDNLYFGGDIFVCEFGFKYNGFGPVSTFINAFFESEVNAELRHEGLINPIVQQYYKGPIDQSLLPVLYSRGYYPPDGKVYVRPEYLKYNLDYSKIQKENPLYVLSDTYNYCSNCENRYPFRIIASEKSDLSEISDKYRSFKSNNFLSLNGNCGGLTDLVVNSDELYAFTKNYPVFIPTKPQTLQTNESNLFVGTGDIFSVPQKRLVTTSFNYGGCQDFMSIVTTEFGTFYADAINGKVFMLANPPHPVDEGMVSFFEKELPFKLDRQLEELAGITFPFRFTTHGVGLSATYDPRLKYIILTKKDYKLARPNEFGGIRSITDESIDFDRLYFDQDAGIFFTKDDPNLEVSLDDSYWFENHSWTLSYSPRRQAWVSFYSYLPNYYFNDGNNFWSFINDNIYLWKHGEGNFQTFYGNKYNHVLEFISNESPSINKVFESLELTGDFTLDDVEVNNTYSYITVFNSNQSSGRKQLKLKLNSFDPDYNLNQVLVSKVDNNFKLNNIRDYSLANESLFSSNWDDIKPVYYIDKVSVNSQFNNYYQLPRLKGKWFGIRLESKLTENIKVTTNFVATKQKISYR